MSNHQDEFDDTGIERRYHVEKVNDPTGKHDQCRYFVLDPQHDPIARFALADYASRARAAGYDSLADDLHAWLSDVAVGVLRERFGFPRKHPEHPCPTEDCPGDARYLPPGRGHASNCGYMRTPPGSVGGEGE